MRGVTSRDLRRAIEGLPDATAIRISINFPDGIQLAKGSTIEAEITPDDDNDIVLGEGLKAWILAKAIVSESEDASSSSLGIERLEQLILATPTGPLRNELCDINILIQSQNLSYE